MRPGQSKSPGELRVITQTHWAFVWTPDGATALILATYPHGPYCQRAQAFAERMERRDRYPQQGTSCLGWDAFRGKDGTQGRQAARGMTARPPGARLLGGVRPLERARCTAPAPGVTPGALLCLVRAGACALMVWARGARRS